MRCLAKFKHVQQQKEICMNFVKPYMAAFAVGLVGAVYSSQAFSDSNINPENFADHAWISLNGEIVSVQPDEFTLNYGEGKILVEMDDGDRDADGYKLFEGDRVTVTGKIDEDVFTSARIEAANVYVKKLDTYFYASAVDEEGDYTDFTLWYQDPMAVGDLALTGIVSEVNGNDFTMNTGLNKITVDTRTMSYDPLDDIGYQRIDEGDLVRVFGFMDKNLLTDNEVIATSSYIIDN